MSTLFLDSDVAFWDHNTTMLQTLRKTAVLNITAPVHRATLAVASDWPFHPHLAMTGIMLWESSALAEEMMLMWWNNDRPQFNRHHPFEQPSFVSGVLQWKGAVLRRNNVYGDTHGVHINFGGRFVHVTAVLAVL